MSAPSSHPSNAASVVDAKPTNSVEAKAQFDLATAQTNAARNRVDNLKREYKAALINKYALLRNMAWRRWTNFMIDESDGGETGRVYHAATEQGKKLIKPKQTRDVFNIPRNVWYAAEEYALKSHEDYIQGGMTWYRHRDVFVVAYTESMIVYLHSHGYPSVTLYHQMIRMRNDIDGAKFDKSILMGLNGHPLDTCDDENRDDYFVDSDIVLSANIAWYLNLSKKHQNQDSNNVLMRQMYQLAVKKREPNSVNFNGRCEYIIERLTTHQKILFELFTESPLEADLSKPQNDDLSRAFGQLDINNIVESQSHDVIAHHLPIWMTNQNGTRNNAMDLIAEFLLENNQTTFEYAVEQAREEIVIQNHIDVLTATLPSNILKRQQKDAESEVATKKKRTE